MSLPPSVILSEFAPYLREEREATLVRAATQWYESDPRSMPPSLLLLAIAFLALLVWAVSGMSSQARKRWPRTLVLGAALLVIALLVRVGLPGLAAAGAALLAIARYLGPLLLRLLPLILASRVKSQQSSDHQTGPRPEPTVEKMTRAEAFQVLGLPENASETEIQAAYRELIQKVHPDRGGTAYLASRVNLAKDLLLPKARD